LLGELRAWGPWAADEVGKPVKRERVTGQKEEQTGLGEDDRRDDGERRRAGLLEPHSGGNSTAST
jgi:hypothetical protein